MANPWQAIPLADYEGHMGASAVDQLEPLARLFGYALTRCAPESVAILGIAGGNGLDEIDPACTHRIVGIDFVRAYLDEAQRRYGALPGLSLLCADLNESLPAIEPVALVHCALVFEHAGLGKALDNALSLLAARGRISIVLQLPSTEEAAVSPSAFRSMHELQSLFQLIEPEKLETILKERGLVLAEKQTQPLKGGKGLWLGIFERERSALL